MRSAALWSATHAPRPKIPNPKAEPYAQTALRRADRKGLQRVDRPGRAKAVVRAERRWPDPRRRNKPRGRRPLPYRHGNAERRAPPRRRRLSRDRPQREADLHLGVGKHPRTGIAGYRQAQEGG